MRISLLDFFRPPSALIPIIEAADGLGYSRFWVGEHHTSTQCHNPLLACAVFAGVASRMRVGTGAMVLAQRSAYELAQDARMLTQLYGDCLDLGVVTADPEQLRALSGLLRGTEESALRTGRSLVWTETVPKLWLLGIGLESARRAGQLGLGYCTSHHHGASVSTIRDSLSQYRDSFTPGILDQPSCIVVRSGICSVSPDVLELLTQKVAKNQSLGLPGDRPQADLLAASPHQLVDRLLEFGHMTGAEELMFLPLAHHTLDDTLLSLTKISESAKLANSINTQQSIVY